MDSLAKSVHQNNMWQAQPFAQSFGRSPVELLVNQRIVTGDAGAALHRAYQAPQMKAELCKKHGWDDGQFEIIDWDSFGAVNRKLEEPDRLQLFKMVHSALPVMRQQNRFEYSTSDTCPRCGDEEETITHMLKCQLRKTESWKEELQDDLKKGRD